MLSGILPTGEEEIGCLAEVLEHGPEGSRYTGYSGNANKTLRCRRVLIPCAWSPAVGEIAYVSGCVLTKSGEPLAFGLKVAVCQLDGQRRDWEAPKPARMAPF